MPYLRVGTGQWDGRALDSKSCSVSAGISRDNIHSAVGVDQAEGGESEDEGLGKHFD